MDLTFLTPTDRTQNQVTKTYKRQADGTIIRLSNYNAGYLFDYVVEQVDDTLPVKDRLAAVAALFKRYRSTHFHLYGSPIPNLVPPCQRLKDHFPPDKDYDFLHLDIDHWPISKIIRDITGFDLTPQTTADTVRLLLAQYGFDWLVDKELLIVLSASQFTLDTLSAHVYFIFEKPVSLSEMRRVSVAFNRMKNGDKLMDHAVYKSVQPDFISAPICDNFKDPVPERIFTSSTGLSTLVTRREWLQFRKTIEQTVGQAIDSKSFSGDLGSNWQDILKDHAGGRERGINQPCYLAAARMVKEIGTARVAGNVPKYARVLYDAAWKEINAKGLRVGPEDTQRYDLRKFESYVQSAANKGIGDEVDMLEREILKAINHTVASAEPIALLNTYVAGCGNKLKERYPVAYARVCNAIKQKTGKLVAMSAWKAAVDNSVATVSNSRNDLIKLLPHPNTAAINQPVQTKKIDLGKGRRDVLENDLRLQLLGEYDLIRPHTGEMLLGRMETFSDGVQFYRVRSFNKKFAAEIQASVEATVKGGVSESFGRRCFTHLEGKFYSGGAAVKTGVHFRRNAFYQAEENALWWNLGRAEGKKPECLLIDPSGVHQMYHDDPRCGGFYWQERATNIEVAPESSLNRFKDFNEVMAYFMERMQYYVNTDTEGLRLIACWLCTALTSNPLPYLLEIVGPAGSGKSTTSTLLKDLVDPSIKIASDGDFDARLKFSKSDESFLNTLEEQRVSIIDNLSKLSPSQQDDLCRFVTGYSFDRRTLYTQIYQNVRIRRPLIVNGINEAITRYDLIERTLRIELDKIDHYNPSFYASWQNDLPILRRCVVALVQKVLFMQSTEGRMSGVNRRELLIGRIISLLSDGGPTDGNQTSIVYANYDAELKAKAYITSKRKAQAINDPHTLQFCLFLNFFCPAPGHKYAASILYAEYTAWFRNNYGQTIKTKLAGEPISHRVSSTFMPTTTQGFGWMLRRIREGVSSISNYTMSRKHRGSIAAFRIFTRRFSLTDII